MKWLWFLSLLIVSSLSAASLAAAPLFTVRTVTYKGSLPYVESGDVRRDARVNHRIFLDQTGLPAPVKHSDGIKPLQNQESLAGSADFSFSVLRNDDRILTLEVQGEACGAYCENYSMRYNFDVATGRMISALDLFTHAGGAELFKQNLTKRVAEYEKAITDLEKEAEINHKNTDKSKSEAEDDKERIEMTRSMYESCAEAMRSPDYGKYYSFADAHSLKIGSESITFVYGRCSNHAMRALDDVGHQEITYKIADLAPYFTAYGKYLLMNGPQAAPRPEPYGQILQGRVGRATITLALSELNSDSSLGGSYFYGKYRVPIELSGKVNGNIIELNEFGNGNSPAMIRATIKEGRLEGQWIGEQTLDFRVEP